MRHIIDTLGGRVLLGLVVLTPISAPGCGKPAPTSPTKTATPPKVALDGKANVDTAKAGIGGTKTNVDIARAKPDYSMSALSLFAEAKKDQQAAQAKYVEKVLLLDGTVDRVLAFDSSGLPFDTTGAFGSGAERLAIGSIVRQ